ncbi:hypothetical protein ACIGCP_14340 [Cellulophaga baltica]|uniref:hypothetical protein n=1 Tax=Cellulophaga baltica TaxID=76594 RepID=UPI0037C9F554
MNSFLIPICIFLLLTISHLAIVSKRLATISSNAIFEIQSWTSTNEYVKYRQSQQQKVFFTILLFLIPLVLFKTLLEYHSGNNALDMILMIGTISIMLYCIWLNVFKLNANKPQHNLIVNERNENIEIKLSESIQTNSNSVIEADLKLVELQDDNLAPTNLLIEANNEIISNTKVPNDLKRYEEFISSHEEFKYFNKQNRQFELSKFSMNGRHTLEDSHACYLLQAYYFEEIKKRSFSNCKVNTTYHLKMNEFFNNEKQVKPSTLSHFRRTYINDSGMSVIKENEFYKELLKFHKK